MEDSLQEKKKCRKMEKRNKAQTTYTISDLVQRSLGISSLTKNQNLDNDGTIDHPKVSNIIYKKKYK